MKTKYKVFFTVVVFLIFVTACVQKKERNNSISNFRGEYMGQEKPGMTAELFAPGFVSNDLPERDATFSPDGKEFYYTVQAPAKYAIVHTKIENGRWTMPEVATFSGVYSDVEPSISPDGNRLYFASNRPLKKNGTVKDWDIWYVEREGDSWSEPVNIGAPVNTEANEFYPCMTSGGSLYFCSVRENGVGGEDIFRSDLIDGKFSEPVALSETVNTQAGEYNAYVSPDESIIMFGSFGRDDGIGGGDMYISFRDESGEWSTAVNMGENINSARLDYCPYLTPDGKYLLFTSNRVGDDRGDANRTSYNEIVRYYNSELNGNDNIFWINADILDEIKLNTE